MEIEIECFFESRFETSTVVGISESALDAMVWLQAYRSWEWFRIVEAMVVHSLFKLLI